eukprot:jgi/Phyca11/127512/e_gw1.70.173.1
MRPSVHPMDVNADGENRPKIGVEDDEWQEVATENSSNTVKLNGTSIANEHELDEDNLDGAAEVPVPPQGGGAGNDYSAAKTGRLLTFADETGGNLVEMSYSNRTHYSKQAGPGAMQGVPKGGCCAIQ